MAPLVLIFGTSHVGKSTLAQSMGERLGWPVHSTDGMGRHPGRPWPEVSEPVAEHYTCLSEETIYWFLKVHQDNIWPYVCQLVTDASALETGSIFEGSALRPEFLAPLAIPKMIPLGLYASDEFLRARILAGSQYNRQDPRRRLIIDKFVRRSLRQNSEFLEVATRLGMPMLNVEDVNALADRADGLVADLSG